MRRFLSGAIFGAALALVARWAFASYGMAALPWAVIVALVIALVWLFAGLAQSGPHF